MNMDGGASGKAGSLSRGDFLKMGGVGLAGASLLGVAGCGGGGGPERDESGAIRVVFSTSPFATDAGERLIEQFNEENRGEINVVFREAPTDTTTSFEQRLTEFQAGGGDVAVIGGDVIWAAQFAANGWIMDLSDLFTGEMRSDFLEGPIEANIFEGAIYGVPWFTDAGMLYFRRDLLEENGFENPPETWDELLEMAAEIQANSDVEFGFVFQGANSESGVVNGLEYINSFGGSALDPDDVSVVTIESPEAAEGLGMERMMVEEGVAPQAVVNYTEEESEAAFLGGDAVFCRNWPYMYAVAGDEEASSIGRDQVGVAPLPRGSGGESASGLGGANFYINALLDEETRQAAWEFVNFITGLEQQRTFALDSSLLPTRSELYDEEEILAAVPVIALAGEALERTVPRPVSPYYSDMSLEMADGFNSSLNGDATAEEAVANLQGSLEDIVEAGERQTG